MYRDAVGSAAWDALPKVLHDMHERGGDGPFTVVSRGFARVLSTLGFAPSPGPVPLTLRIEKTGSGERWIRNFRDEVFATTLRLDRGAIAEKIGIIEVRFKVFARGLSLLYEVIGLRVFGLTVPPWMWPKLEASERADGPRVSVTIAVGKAFRYSGFITPR
jgi:hypothetical protein